MELAAMIHGGNLRLLAHASHKPERDILDFSASLNPLGPPDWLRPLISSHVGSLVHYPDLDCTLLTEAAAERYGVGEKEIIAGNGSTELLYLIPRVFGKSAIIPVPSYIDYTRACSIAGKTAIPFPLTEETGFALNLDSLGAALHGDELVFIGQPNNPTGLVCDPEAIRQCARKHPSTLFVIDEAFADFVEGLDRLTRDRPSNVIVLLSLTKIFAIPGLRLGCAVADPVIIERLRASQPPWSVSTLAQAVGAAAVRDREYLDRTREYVRIQRNFLARALNQAGEYTVYPGEANFLLVRIDRPGLSASELADRLLMQGVAIRRCENFEGLDKRFFRIAVRTESENLRLCELLCKRSSHRSKKKKPAIMFQGTSSNAGKSILTTALCRILLQDGYRVAPFKAQNMSLNSFVTREGGEMGRAQVVQAQACHIEPETRMNPILMKPSSDTGAQVIVNGKPVGNMNVEEYIRFKPEAFRAAQQAFDSLADEYDAVVLEGAGSPAEVNLKSHDIVNMNMARYAASPVLLVGDIDRGGVFASFVGTMEVLEEWERNLVAGFLVNRFRGRESLLKEALDYTERHTGRSVLGVIPYLSNLGLPEEDSVTFKSMVSKNEDAMTEGIDIALIDLPHISNFTDFDALKNEPDVNMRVVRAPEDLGNPDVIILPGSKNVLEDLACLRRCGLDSAVVQLAPTTEVVGICGGYQMLGGKIDDATAIESSHGAMRGLGLLELSTVMAEEKTLVRVEAVHQAGLPLQGYEIHHGRSDVSALDPVIIRSDGEVIGAGRGNVWGTYMHGVFDADEFRRWFIDRLRKRRGFQPLGRICAPYNLEPALDRLAEVVRKSIRMDAVYRLMGLR
jgi:adenosylcobyric acid synthase